MRHGSIAGLLLLVLPVLVRAQTAPLPEPATAIAPVETPRDPLTFYGFGDGYYGYDFRHPTTHERPAFLYSHNRHNEFTVNNVVLGVRYEDERVRGALGLHAGSYVAANYAAEDQVFKHIYEAYAGFRPFKKVWFDVGVFGSHIGFESALSKDNWTLTRSLMAENSPYYESGARLSYEANSRLTLTGLLLNGWQNIRETNQAKAVGTQVQWKPTAKWVVNSSTFYGNEQPQDSARGRRLFHDFFVRYAATRRLSLAMVFDAGRQERAQGGGADTWHTGAAFVRYQLPGAWALALRAEYYRAERGVIIDARTPLPTAAAVHLQGTSLNVDYAPTSHLLVRVEGRLLMARHPIFPQQENTYSDRYGNLTSSVAFSF